MAAFRTLDELTGVDGKRVLVRVDLNVPLKDGAVGDTTRIERVAPTIRELSEKGAKVILLAHFGRPKGNADPAMSLAPIVPAVAEITGLNVGFSPATVGVMCSNPSSVPAHSVAASCGLSSKAKIVLYCSMFSLV